MRRFAFRLERLLHLRRQRERASSENLARAVAQVLDQERHLARLRETWRRWAEQRERLLAGARIGPDLETIFRFLDELERRRAEGRVVLRELEHGRDEARRQWERAYRDRETVERLRQRRFQAYVRELAREDVKIVDEAAAGRRQRQTMAEGR